MSARYEHVEATAAPIRLVGPGTELGDDVVADQALVIGNKYATALVVEGSPDELTALVDTLAAALRGERGPGPVGHPLETES